MTAPPHSKLLKFWAQSFLLGIPVGQFVYQTMCSAPHHVDLLSLLRKFTSVFEPITEFYKQRNHSKLKRSHGLSVEKALIRGTQALLWNLPKAS